MELRNIGLSQQVWEQLHSIGRQKEASPLETLEMTLRQHFGLPVTEKWKIDSWIQSGDIYESVVVMSKRAKQVLSDRIVEEIIESNDEEELGVYDELIEANPDDYEELVKPTTVSVNEFLDGEIDWKKNDEDES